MDFGLQEVLMAAGAVAVVAVLVHGLLAMRRNNQLRIKLDHKFVDTELGDSETSDLMLLRAELPNGGARVVRANEAHPTVRARRVEPGPDWNDDVAPGVDVIATEVAAKAATPEVPADTGVDDNPEQDIPVLVESVTMVNGSADDNAGEGIVGSVRVYKSDEIQPGEARPGEARTGEARTGKSKKTDAGASDAITLGGVDVTSETATSETATSATARNEPDTSDAASGDVTALGVRASDAAVRAEISPLETSLETASLETASLETASLETASLEIASLEIAPLEIVQETPVQAEPTDHAVSHEAGTAEPMADDALAPAAPSTAEPAQELRPVVLTVLAEGGMFPGAALLRALESLDMTWGDMQIFHRLDARGDVEFSLANAVEPGTFDPDTMEQTETPGVTLFMIADELTDPGSTYENMLMVAQMLADDLNGSVKDERRNDLTAQSIDSRRDSLRGYRLQQA